MQDVAAKPSRTAAANGATPKSAALPAGAVVRQRQKASNDKGRVNGAANILASLSAADKKPAAMLQDASHNRQPASAPTSDARAAAAPSAAAVAAAKIRANGQTAITAASWPQTFTISRGHHCLSPDPSQRSTGCSRASWRRSPRRWNVPLRSPDRCCRCRHSRSLRQFPCRPQRRQGATAAPVSTGEPPPLPVGDVPTTKPPATLSPSRCHPRRNLISRRCRHRLQLASPGLPAVFLLLELKAKAPTRTRPGPTEDCFKCRFRRGLRSAGIPSVLTAGRCRQAVRG